jgi:hypothetical protein
LQLTKAAECGDTKLGRRRAGFAGIGIEHAYKLDISHRAVDAGVIATKLAGADQRDARF